MVLPVSGDALSFSKLYIWLQDVTKLEKLKRTTCKGSGMNDDYPVKDLRMKSIHQGPILYFSFVNPSHGSRRSYHRLLTTVQTLLAIKCFR